LGFQRKRKSSRADSAPVEWQAGEEPSANGEASDLLACRSCGQVQRLPAELQYSEAKCARCHKKIYRYSPGSRARTGALALAALALYWPANIYPVITMDLMGRHSENTVWSGVVSLCQDGMYFIGGLVFMASILIPVLKILALFFLSLDGGRRNPRFAAILFDIVCKAGPWAMLDVFLLAIAVALIRFGAFGHVEAGPGILYFGCVVVLTLFASSSFDPWLIWKDPPA
jgi:paraquat-inducible protein A